MIVAMTGTTGNMGREALRQVLELGCVDKVRILLTPRKRNAKEEKRLRRRYGARVEFVHGRFADTDECREQISRLVVGADYVVHMAAVIPPTADHHPKACYACNVVGTRILVDAIKACPTQPKLVHTSTMALYGHRDEKHPWCRVGDPLMPSPYDRYARDKLAGERYVLESGLEHWAVVRQTAMLHQNMLTDNLKDGLMYHTVFNTPLEWLSARDSGYLIKRIIERDAKGEIDDFWRRVYNIGAGEQNRKTGYETFSEGFAIIGGSPEKFFRPNWFAVRNFHGVWFADSDVLQEYFGYQRDTTKAYWREIGRKHWYYGLGKLVPAKLISALLLKPLLKDENAPMEWLASGKDGKVQAYLGGRAAAETASQDWKDVDLFCKKDGYEEAKNAERAVAGGRLLDVGYDESKPIPEWTIEDMREAAAFRGGECLSESMQKGDAYTPLRWRCCDGHEFTATPYTVLKGGHWCDACAPGKWNYDALAKKVPFYAQVWYDTHAHDEDTVYWYDEDEKPCFAPIPTEGE